MKKILVLGLGHLSNGEITIAVSALRSLQNNDYQLLFVSHTGGERYIAEMGVPAMSLSNPNPSDNRREFNKLLADWRPDVLLCADVYTMDYASTWTGFDFSYLKSLGLPVGSFDQYEWESTDFICDFVGSHPVRMREALISELDFLIRPCPLNKPTKSDGRIISCNLFGESPKSLTSTTSEWRAKLDLPVGKKVVLTVNSGWEFVEISRTMHLGNLMQWMPRILHEYLSSLEEPLVLLHVSPKPWEFPVSDKIDYRYYKNMPASLYEESLFYSDLFFGTNAISITLSRAVSFKVPAVLFQNLKILDFSILEKILPKLPAWYGEMAKSVKEVYPFRIFPWGWTRFLTPVFSDNLYTETFKVAPIFEPTKSIQILQSLLFDDTARTRLRETQGKYFESISELPPLCESLRFLNSNR